MNIFLFDPKRNKIDEVFSDFAVWGLILLASKVVNHLVSGELLTVSTKIILGAKREGLV